MKNDQFAYLKKRLAEVKSQSTVNSVIRLLQEDMRMNWVKHVGLPELPEDVVIYLSSDPTEAIMPNGYQYFITKFLEFYAEFYRDRDSELPAPTAIDFSDKFAIYFRRRVWNLSEERYKNDLIFKILSILDLER